MHEHPGQPEPAGQVRGVDRAGQFGKRDEEMQACGDALNAGSRQLLGELGEQGIAPVPLPLADQADVPLEFTAGDQVGQDQLRQRGTPQVTGMLGGDQVGLQRGWGNQPADAQAGGQRLGGAAGVGDPVRR